MEQTIYNGVRSEKLQSYYPILHDSSWVHTIQYSGTNDEEMIYIGFKDIDGTELQAHVFMTHTYLYVVDYVKQENGRVAESLCPYSSEPYKTDDIIEYINNLPKTINNLKTV